MTIDTARLRELAEKAVPGPWDLEYDDETVEVNAGSARTTWNEAHTVGFPASSWAPRDRILERDVGYLDEAEADEIAADAEYIAAANPQTVLALLDEIDRLRSAIREALSFEASLPAIATVPHRVLTDALEAETGLSAPMEQS